MNRKTIDRAAFFLAAIILTLGAGCSSAIKETKQYQPSKRHTQPYKVFGKYYQPLASAKGFKQRGTASWYGEKFHGRKTSNGETYDMYGISAAHKTLPFGTYVRVTNLDNQKQLVVRINDRGPFVKGRIIDLSFGAAKKLGVVGPGTAKVVIEALGRKTSSNTFTPVDFYRGNFTVQVGAFKVKENAVEQKNLLSRRFKNAHISVFDRYDGTFYRVRIGKTAALEEAVRYEKELIDQGFTYAFVVAE